MVHKITLSIADIEKLLSELYDNEGYRVIGVTFREPSLKPKDEFVVIVEEIEASTTPIKEEPKQDELIVLNDRLHHIERRLGVLEKLNSANSNAFSDNPFMTKKEI